MEKEREGLFFTPHTNMNDPKLINQCYRSRSNLKEKNNMTGVVQYPNKSEKILKDETDTKPKMLTKQKPLGFETKPVAGLHGGLWTQMVEMHN